MGFRFPVSCLLTLILLMQNCESFLFPRQFVRQEAQTLSHDWTETQESKDLHFHKCYDDGFECARLIVPLDWNNPSNPNNISIAVIRLPAVVDRTDKSFGGTIVVNPGGPGGSGTDFVLLSGQSLQRMVDSEKHFEILSFDPRGIKFTKPNVACFQDQAARLAQALLGAGAGGIDDSKDALNVKWAIDQGLGKLCMESGSFDDGSNIREYVSTALVARDMVAIIDKLDETLKEELSTNYAVPGSQKPISAPSGDSDKVPLLNYYGFSYGTYLGNTFASLFPERIGRMVLDGVVDADDYAATGWTTNLADNAKAWSLFFEDCFDAGMRCPLYDVSYNSSNDIRDRVNDFIEDLKENPIPWIINGNASLMTHFLIKVLIHVTIYLPNAYYPMLAQILVLLEAARSTTEPLVLGKQDLWAHPLPQGFAPSLPPIPAFQALLSSHFDDPTNVRHYGYDWQLEAAAAILCGDGDDITRRSKTNFTSYLELLQEQSELVAPVWAEIALHCIHWPHSLRPSGKNRFTGPFRSNLTDYDSRASPLLFIGNTADPVTPVRNAHKMSSTHEGSVVFTQDMPGHCSSEISPTTCGFSVTKAFFANGTLPEPGLVCKGIRKPWDY